MGKFTRIHGERSGSSLSPRCWGLLVWLFLAGITPAQTPSGGVRGRVLDADFQQPILNATVRLIENGRTVETDPSGNFFFNELPPGNYTLSANREGYRGSQNKQIAVSAGAISEAELELEGEIVELDDFVVSSEDLVTTESQQLLSIRQDLTAFADVLGADFISKVGGTDVGDVVKRIVGTSVADSRYVVIRGLSDRYNTVLLNGARIPSSDPDKRAVNIDIFPSNLVGELSNTKTFTPDLPGESTGGSINIVTKSSPDKPFVSVSIGTGYNTQATQNKLYVTYQGAGTGLLGTQGDRRIPSQLKGSTKDSLPLNPATPEQIATSQAATRLLDRRTGTTTGEPPLDVSFNASAGTRIQNFFGGSLGLLGAFTYSKKYEFDPNVVREETTIDGSKTPIQTREFVSQEGAESLLSGLLLSAGWQSDSNDQIKLTFFANVAAEDRAYFQQGLVDNGATPLPGTIAIDDAEQIAVREGLQYTERRLRTLQLSGSHEYPAFHNASTKWAMAYSLSSQDEPDGRFTTVLFDRPSQSFTQLPEFAGQNLQRYWRHLDDTDYNILFEFKVPIFKSPSGEESGVLRTGGNFDYSTREFRADTFGYSNAIFSGAGIPLTGKLDPSNEQGLTAADKVGSLSAATIGRARNPEIYDASQVIGAVFAAVETNLTRTFRASVGLRAEVTDIRVFRDPSAFRTAGGQLDASEGPVTDPFNANQVLPDDKIGRADIEQVDVLPAMSLSWDFAKDMKLRFAASRTVARPSFKELSPIYLDDPVSTDRFRGNSLLEMSTIDNVDVRWEWFPGAGDVVAISGFTKYIDQPIELFTNPTADFFANQDNAVIYGYEFEIQKNLGFLAEPLRPFAIGLNASKFYSKVELIDIARQQRIDAGLDPVRRLQGQPDYLLNFNLTYDHKESGLFAGLFLNVTGETLYQAGSSAGSAGFSADVYQQPFTSLDFTLSKKWGDHFKLTFRAENLLNEDTRRLGEGNLDYAKSSGTKYSISINGSW